MIRRERILDAVTLQVMPALLRLFHKQQPDSLRSPGNGHYMAMLRVTVKIKILNRLRQHAIYIINGL